MIRAITPKRRGSSTGRDQAERDLRTALLLDGGDWFTFEAGPGRAVADMASGTRVPINARFSTISLVWADGGYAGRLVTWACKILSLTVEIVKLMHPPV